MQCTISAVRADLGTWNDNIHTISSETSLHEAAQRMLAERVSSLPVIDEHNMPIDVLCKSDIARVLSKRRNFQTTLVREKVSTALAMRPSPGCFVSTGDLVASVLDNLLNQRHFRAIFVVDGSRIIGCVSLSDLNRHILHWPKPNTLHVSS